MYPIQLKIDLLLILFIKNNIFLTKLFIVFLFFINIKKINNNYQI